MKLQHTLAASVLLPIVFLTVTDLVHAAKDNKTIVFAVNYPLAYFAERIGGDLIDIYYPIPADIDPAFWKPSTDEILKIQQTDLILLNGANYAKWIKKVSLPYSKQVNTSRSFKKDYIHIKETVTHQHGPGGEHSHAGTAFTTWLDLSQAHEQAGAVMEALVKKQPSAKSAFEQNYQSLSQELQEMDAKLKKIITTDKPVLASHPVYQYLARHYGINLQSVMWEPESYPSEEQWTEFKKLVESHPAGWMLWEAEPDPKTTQRLTGMNIQVIVFSPLMNRPETGDFMSIMQQNIKNITSVYQ